MEFYLSIITYLILSVNYYFFFFEKWYLLGLFLDHPRGVFQLLVGSNLSPKFPILLESPRVKRGIQKKYKLFEKDPPSRRH